MLDKITNNSSEIISQSQNLDRINSLGVSNPYEDNRNNFFIDESNISSVAMEKYQREIDVKKFSEIFNQMDEKEANNLVMQNVFDGKFSIEDNDFLSKLLGNEDFINEVFENNI